MGQGEIGDFHDIEAPLSHQNDGNDDDKEVIIGGGGAYADAGGLSNEHCAGMDDGEAESDNHNNDQAPPDPVGRPCWPRRPREGCVNLKDSQNP